MTYALRRLFATILVHSEPTDVRNLWNPYLEAMSEDFNRPHRRRSREKTKDSAIILTSKSINYFLESMGKSLSDYDLPCLPTSSDHDSYSREIEVEKSIQIPDIDRDAEFKLNTKQKVAFPRIIARVNSGNSGVFFVDRHGGTGKTFLYQAILTYLRSNDIIAIVTPTSGVAVHILPGGRTVHSRFKIPLEENDDSMCHIKKQSGLGDLFSEAKLIIWNETPMAKRWAIETIEIVERTLRDITGNTRPFGGKVMVFAGDQSN
ncbi:hypothetical protein LIER_19804 [Lithospermum erythrorhizon]|uniref:ATP-dependent DNA helicase n=1 Tax=Lithospermum erythrorhizon TaxID=34254 RepID=A0AAV3QKM5_LITER